MCMSPTEVWNKVTLCILVSFLPRGWGRGGAGQCGARSSWLWANWTGCESRLRCLLEVASAKSLTASDFVSLFVK